MTVTKEFINDLNTVTARSVHNGFAEIKKALLERKITVDTIWTCPLDTPTNCDWNINGERVENSFATLKVTYSSGSSYNYSFYTTFSLKDPSKIGGEKTTCMDCGKDIPMDTKYKNPYFGKICLACSKKYVVCQTCGASIRKESMVKIEETGELMCSSCARDNYVSCSCCKKYVNKKDIWAEGDKSICNACASKYAKCSDCRNIDLKKDFVFDTYDDAYCKRCAKNHEVRAISSGATTSIQSYSYKPFPTFFGATDRKEGYGLELEIDGGERVDSTSLGISKIGKDAIYLKHDGSLSNGIEIVTNPCTLDYHTNVLPWEQIMSFAKSRSFKSCTASTCGLHIHASRTLFGDDEKTQDLNIAKVIILISKYWTSNIVPFSRRSVSRLDQWAGKPTANIKATDTEDEVIEKAKNIKGNGRYQAVNLQNKRTVEFRFFKGTLKKDNLVAAIQFVDYLISFVKETSLKDVIKVKWEDIFASSQYSELNSFLNNIKLGNGKNEEEDA